MTYASSGGSKRLPQKVIPTVILEVRDFNWRVQGNPRDMLLVDRLISSSVIQGGGKACLSTKDPNLLTC